MKYSPENPPEDAAGLRRYLFDELSRIAAVFEAATAREIEFLTVAPKKPREGMIRGADGTFWNPGSGKGVYAYYNNTWNKL